MTKEEIQQQVADALRDAANKIDPALNQVGQPPKPETTEAAQEAHEAKFESFNRDKSGRSLNSKLTPEQTKALLKEKDETENK
jgi:hypothetical protein